VEPQISPLSNWELMYLHLLNDMQYRHLYVGEIYILMKAMQ